MGATEAAWQPLVVRDFRRVGGTFSQAPEPAQLRLQFQPKEVRLMDAKSRRPLFTLPLRGRRGLAAAVAALEGSGLVACRLRSVRLEEEEAGGDDEGAEGGVPQEQLHALLEVQLLGPLFEEAEAEEGGEGAASEAAPCVAALVDHWEALREDVEAQVGQQQQEGNGEAAEEEGEKGRGAAWPFAAELAACWWQAGGEEAEGEDGEGEGGNPRDRIFEMVLPSDWQLEAGEPEGLSCTLFRYQRRCLSWLLWRESLGGGSRDAASTSSGSGAAACDAQSAKAALPSSSLLWQPLTLPSGQRVFYEALQGGLRTAAVTPALPEVPGGLLCDEMGLGKTVEMLALFLANPPPQGLQQQSQPSAAAATEAEGGASQEQEEAAAGGGSNGRVNVDRAQAASLPANGTANGASSGSAPRGGTLVVCPPALLQQWQSEISNHAHGALVVEVYDGLRGLQASLNGEGPAKKRLKPAQREMELYARLLAGEEVEPSFDAEAEAAAALRRMQAADVVLTSFDVLRMEVNFVPNSRTFRRPKKYAVPHCPLLQMHWWRLVIDEAQMVGPLSAAGTMCERMHAVHRWCVTGTPMGAHRNELTDIHALLHTLQHQPFGDARAWQRLLADPLASGGGHEARHAWSLLGRVLRPLMWRNTKGVVAQEFHLPHRSLHPVWLQFQPGERAFYEQVVEKTREAREELLSFRRRQEEAEAGSDEEGEGEGEDDDEEYGRGKRRKRTTPAALRSRQRARARQVERLESAALENITQLRLSCVHPQLTKMWKDMQAEGQIGVGATLSMEEIMQRLVESAQNDLQEAERDLCAHLNTLAMRLLAKAESASEAGASPRTAAGGQAAEDEEGAAGAPPAKRARKSRGGFDAMGREELRAQALLLLERSFRVAEKGIAALDVSMEDLKGMADIEAASTSTVNAWKRLQINTASRLAKLHAAAGREELAQKMERDAQGKMSYLRAQAQMEVTSAEQKLDQVQQHAESARQAFTLHFAQATERGFSGWGITAHASRWLAALERGFREAQAQEARELEAQDSGVQAMLGKRVTAALDDVEKQLHGELTQLERYVGEQHAAAGSRRLAREQHGWERRGAGPSFAASPSEGAVVSAGVGVVWELLRLLPDFRRKTLLAQHVNVFSKLLADEAEKKAAEAARRKAEADAQRAAAAAANRGQEAGPAEAEVEEVSGSAAGQVPPAGGQEQQPGAQQPEQQPEQQQRQQAQPAASEAEGQAAAQHAGQELAAVLQAVEAGQAFVSSSCWQGGVKGYVFKLGGSGLGYYCDVAPAGEATLEQLHAVATAVARALLEHQRRLAKAAGPEASFFASLSLDAVEAKLESVKQQIQLVRALREQHVAERTLALKEVLQADLDADLRAAADLPPLPSGGTVEKLAKEIEALKEQAQSQLHRKRYMASRVNEARQLQPAAGRVGLPGGQQAPTSAQGEQQQQGASPGQQEQQAQQQPGASPEQQSQQMLSSEQQAQQAGPSGQGEESAGEAAVGSAPAAAGPSTADAVAGADHAGGMECPVCLTLVPAGQDVHVFSACGHAFCKDCAAKLVLLQGACAVCRQKVTRNQVFRVAAGGARSTSAHDPEFEALGKIQPQGEWSSKVEALLRRLLHLQTTAPAEKALIFSQFPDALKLVALALQTNGIKFVQLLGGRQAARKAVASFREDEEVRVFLLSHRAGAAGLTLVRANHIFLLEPAMEPAIEQQAVARVHRIGQQRPVVVTRLLVHGSIEEAVLSRQEAKHALFAGADGGAEDTAELATTVEAPVRPETLGEEDVRGLLEGM